MKLFEKRAFLLDNRAKIVFLECISHCLGSDRRGDDVVNKMGGFNSIIKLSSGNLANDRLFVTSRKLGRTATFVVFLVQIHFFAYPANGRLP